MKIYISNIPSGQFCTLAGLIDVALPSCSWKRIFTMTLATQGLDAAYVAWRRGPLVNVHVLPQIEALIGEIKNDFAKRQGS